MRDAEFDDIAHLNISLRRDRQEGMPVVGAWLWTGRARVADLALCFVQSFGASLVLLGPAGLVRIGDMSIPIILNTNGMQAFEPDVFSNLGLDPLAQDV